MPISIVLDNDAVLVTRIDDASVTAHADQPIRHGNALLIGVRDGGGALLHRSNDETRYFPVARGRADWLGAGELLALAGGGRSARPCSWTCGRCRTRPGCRGPLGDKLLFENETVCVYEEILGPSQVRPMHSHAPRLIVPLTGAHVAQRFPSGEAREDRFPAGGAHWAPNVMVHEIRNIGAAPFWAIVVEHV